MMRPRFKVGLMVGAVCFLPALLTSGICCLAPFLLIFVGSAAGYFTVKEESPAQRDKGAALGALSAAIAGIMPIAGDLVLSWFVIGHIKLPDDPSESLLADPVAFIKPFIPFFAMALFLLPFAVAAGAIAGYMGSPSPPQPAVEEHQSGN